MCASSQAFLTLHSMTQPPDPLAPKRKHCYDVADAMDSAASVKRIRSYSDQSMVQELSSPPSDTRLIFDPQQRHEPQSSPNPSGTYDMRGANSEPRPLIHHHYALPAVSSQYATQQQPMLQPFNTVQHLQPRNTSESANSIQMHDGQLPSQQPQPVFVSQPTNGTVSIPAESTAVHAAQFEDTSMEEDSPAGMRQSSSAPDLYMMMQDSRHSLPRALLDSSQSPLSSTVMGALVPYSHPASTKEVISEAHAYQQRMALFAAMRAARRQQAANNTVIEELDNTSPETHGGPVALSSADYNKQMYLPKGSFDLSLEPMPSSGDASPAMINGITCPNLCVSDTGSLPVNSKRSLATAAIHADELASKRLRLCQEDEDTPMEIDTS